MRTTKEFKDEVRRLVNVGVQVVWVHLRGDEQRCEDALRDLAMGDRVAEDSNDRDRSTGIGFAYQQYDSVEGCSWNPELQSPVQLLEAVDSQPPHTLIVAKDLVPYLNGTGNPAFMAIRRRLLELCKTNQLNCADAPRVLVVLSSLPDPHEDIAEHCAVVDFPAPSADDVLMALDYIDRGRQSSEGEEVDPCPPEMRSVIVDKLRGMPITEVENILGMAATVGGGEWGQASLDEIAKQKAMSLRKVDGLSFVPNDEIADIESVGGFEVYRDFVRRRRRLISDQARGLSLPKARGVVLLGPGGTGKTMMAMTTAKMMGLDLYTLDVGALFDSLVGSTEAKVRAALSMVSALHSGVLLIDELDKVFGGAHKNQASDSGVSSRALSYFLKWLDKDRGDQIFTIVTMNRVDGLPPELLRVGRFDAIFYTDLPNDRGREEIIDILLAEIGLPADHYKRGKKALVAATKDFTGAELRGMFNEARFDAFDKAMDRFEQGLREEPDQESIAPSLETVLESAERITPVAVLDEEEFRRNREFCRKHAVPVHADSRAGEKRTRAARRLTSNN